MDNTRTVEKLIILLDYTEGVLARLYHATQHKPGPEINQIPKDISRFLLRKVPDPTDGIWELESMSQIHTRRTELADETQFVYSVFHDFLDTSIEIAAVIKHITNNILNFNLETNSDVVVRTFDLLSNFTRMHLLAARISECAKLSVLVHSVCAKQQNNTHLLGTPFLSLVSVFYAFGAIACIKLQI